MSVRPTNSWFMNFILETGRQPVSVLPYWVSVQTNGLDVCYPTIDSTSFSTAVLAPMVQNISLRSTAAPTTQKLTAYTDLGCTITWTAGANSMVSNLVRGSAYTTMKYNNLTPVVNTIHAFISINGTSVGGTGSFSGTKFKCVLNNGQTWIIYASSAVTFVLSGQTLTANAAFNGTIRVAVLPSDTGAEAALDLGSSMIATGGSVKLSVDGNKYTKTFTYTTTGTGTLITYIMPHHQDLIVSPAYSGLSLNTIRGVLKAISGNGWVISMDIPGMGWNNKNPIDGSRIGAIQSALDSDESFIPVVNDPYFGGKQLAKSARLILIADQLGDTVARDNLLNNLKNVMNAYLNGGLGTKLRYDTVWGGVVSEVGLTDGGADFGNGRYNDHYFHYGYTIFAAAIIAKFDPSWVNTYKDKINDLVRDIANPSVDDPYFVRFRHFDHFEGHSWAAGTFEFDANRNQESTSEAVNAWYGIWLWGIASNQNRLTMLGQALFTEEVVTAKRYWQVKKNDTLYPTPFRNNGAVGILWGSKVDYGTWFGAEAEKIHGIQILPITPATEVLVDPAWINETWPNQLLPVWVRNPPATDGWKSVLLGAYSQINADDAWTRAQALTGWDDGNSKTQILYHIATQKIAPEVPTEVTAGNGAAPVTSFTATPLTGTAVPMVVQFTDTSTNAPTSWAWDFGDGQVGTDKNPSHSYAALGTYTVSLTTMNLYGENKVTKTGYVNITGAVAAPVANFSTSSTSGTL